ncbi:two-component system response regulator NarL [Sutterella sp.]|uniref:two-component system response regulator NarL n=1 Tax=Sutterella sp. TaxID=1981025 RepID=UPI0026E0D681|nr:two-component system response regulator NarL [Sutterella sp.]MDO5530489.1 two-component system response regulator NarL [Sutterella sp.]
MSNSADDKRTVLVVDDHPLFRRGVRELLLLDEATGTVWEAGNREEAIQLANEHEPDLIVLDLNMKGSSGVEILTHLKAEDPSRCVVILTVSDSGEDLIDCIRAGADGYFLKDMEPEKFLASVHEALIGHVVVDPNMTKYLTKVVKEKPKPVEPTPLTDREQEVIECIAQGLSNKLIARRLNISDGTVKGHVKHLLKKLGLNSRVEAAVWYLSNGPRRRGAVQETPAD